MPNYRQIKAIEAANKKKLLKINPDLDDKPGIYFLTRVDADGFKFAYIGQAKHCLTRLAGHMTGYQHIDRSLKSHGFWSKDNPEGWKIGSLHCAESELDELEKKYIKAYADAGYQLRNKTAGGQGKGKKQIDEYKPAKTYRDGLAQGRINASREVSHLFEKHLNVMYKSDPPNRYQVKAMEKFEAFMKEGDTDG